MQLQLTYRSRFQIVLAVMLGASLLLMPAIAKAESFGGAWPLDTTPGWHIQGDADVVQVDGRRAVRARSEGQIIGGTDWWNTFTGTVVTYWLDNPVTWADVTRMEAEYKGLIGTFGSGSPRFSVALDGNGEFDEDFDPVTGQWSGTDAALHVLWGDASPWRDVPTGDWQTTGNLIDAEDLRFDSHGLPGGSWSETYADTLTKYGSMQVLGMYVAVDGGYDQPDTGYVQELLIDQIVFEGSGLSVNSATYTAAIPLPSAAWAGLALLGGVWLSRRLSSRVARHSCSSS